VLVVDDDLQVHPLRLVHPTPSPVYRYTYRVVQVG